MNRYRVVLAVTLLASACASARPADVAPPSTQPASRPTFVPADGTKDVSSNLPTVRARPLEPRPASASPATVERSSPALSEALAWLSVDPTPENRVAVGDAYRGAGILDQAFEQYSQASKLEPRNAAAWDGMARIWRDWGYPDRAMGSASRAVSFAPHSAAAHNTLGTIFEALEKHREARAEFERALVLEPQAAYALNNVCHSWVAEGNGTAAAAACRRALILEPNLAPARNNLALAYAVQGDLQAAEREFAVARSPAALAYNLGVLHMARRHYGAAAAAFSRAAALEPGMPLAAERARQAHQLALAHPDGENDNGRQ
jgi:tetratricopeptide (TPR) repeat protein